MISLTINQNGHSYECPYGIKCPNPTCAGELELFNEFANGQEIWKCPLCKTTTYYKTINAKLQELAKPSLSETIYSTENYSSEPVVLKCAWCKQDYVSYALDDNPDLCEACSMTAKMQHWTN